MLQYYYRNDGYFGLLTTIVYTSLYNKVAKVAKISEVTKIIKVAKVT